MLLSDLCLLRGWEHVKQWQNQGTAVNNIRERIRLPQWDYLVAPYIKSGVQPLVLRTNTETDEMDTFVGKSVPA